MIGARDLDQGASREGDAHSLALAAVDSVVPKPATGGAIRRPSRATVRARAVAVRERGDDEVAHTDAAYLCPDLLYYPDELVADWAQRGGTHRGSTRGRSHRRNPARPERRRRSARRSPGRVGP